jgi:hypothetical protein
MYTTSTIFYVFSTNQFLQALDERLGPEPAKCAPLHERGQANHQSCAILFLHPVTLRKYSMLETSIHMILTHWKGVVLSMLTTGFFSIAQTAIVRLPLIRRKLNIPRLPKPTPPPGVYDSLKFGFKNLPELLSKLVARITNKRVADKTQSKTPARHKPKPMPSSRR